MIRSIRFFCSFILLIASASVIAGTTPPPAGKRPKGLALVRAPSRLFVVDAQSGWAVKESEGGWRLTLLRPQNVLWFTDRPARDSGFMKASALAADWQQLFAGAPPNGAVTAPGGPEGKSPSAVTITAPRYSATTHELSVLITPLPGETAKDVAWLGKLTRRTAGKNGRVVMFIDDGSGKVKFTVVAPLGTTFAIDTADSNCATPYAITDSGNYAGGEGEMYHGSMYINDSGSCGLKSSTAYWTLSGGGMGGNLEIDTAMGSSNPYCSQQTCSTDQSGYLLIK